MKNPIVPAVLVAATLAAAELPVKRVVLYKHGVGFFERSGEVPAGETARLEFKPGEMNDVLKSLILDTAAGAKVTGVRYDSAAPADSAIELEDAVPLAQFLDTLRGAKVQLDQGSGSVSGSILSGRVVPPAAQLAQQELLVLLTDSGDLRTINLSTVNSVRLTDPLLQTKLRDHLLSLAGRRSQQQRSVYIDGDTARARQIRASYLLPTPIWKSSYRLILSDKPILEGWAIVDNTTDSDWTNISLLLVSGKPVSFQSRLYDPRFIDRPFAELAEERAALPQVYQGNVAGGIVGGLAGGVPGGAPPPPPAPMSKSALRPRLAASPEVDMAMVQAEAAPSAVTVSTGSRELGELFEYSFSTPVTVKKNESAMLPFLQQPIEAKRLLIYSDESEANPRTAAEISNNTGKTLDGGPITVFDNGAYAGEALVETVKNADKRLISYGVDLGTRITTNIDSSSRQLREFRANRGVLFAKASREDTKTYTIRNVDARAKTLVIEHPLRSGFKLLAPASATERTATAYRFTVPLKPSSNETFTVKEEFVYDETLAISSMNPDLLATYLRNPNLSAAGRQALEKVAALKAQITAADARLRANEASQNSLTRDQERLRQNIASLNAVSGQQQQVQKYATDLAGQESRLATLRDQAEAERAKKAALESELNGLLANLSF